MPNNDSTSSFYELDARRHGFGWIALGSWRSSPGNDDEFKVYLPTCLRRGADHMTVRLYGPARAQASTQAVVDQRDSAEHFEAAARAAGFLDAEGFFFQSDEEFLADLQFDGIARADSDLSETGAATLSLSLAA